MLIEKEFVTTPEDTYTVRESLNLLEKLGWNEELLKKLATEESVL